MATKTVAAHPVTDAEMKERSGKSWSQWFKVLDDFGGPAKGRREIGVHLQDVHKLDPWLSSTLIVEYEAHHGVVEKDGKPKGYMICATKSMGVPVESAYKAWSTPAGWDRWFTNRAKFELKEGSRYSTGDGDVGEFKKIRPNKAIKFTWENPKHTPGTTVEVTFQPKGDDKCVVMVAHDRIQTRAEADELRQAWGGVLDKLKNVLEA